MSTKHDIYTKTVLDNLQNSYIQTDLPDFDNLPNNVENILFKHGMHLPAINSQLEEEAREDTIVIKEVHLMKDGTRENHLRVLTNFRKPIYFTKRDKGKKYTVGLDVFAKGLRSDNFKEKIYDPDKSKNMFTVSDKVLNIISKCQFRNHLQKKQSEWVGRLDCVNVIESDIDNFVSYIIHREKETMPINDYDKEYSNFRNKLVNNKLKHKSLTRKDINRSPYVYGIDIDVVIYLKNYYALNASRISNETIDTFNGTTNTIGYYDIEAHPCEKGEAGVIWGVSYITRVNENNINVHVFYNNQRAGSFNHDDIKKRFIDNMSTRVKEILGNNTLNFKSTECNNATETITEFYKIVNYYKRDIMTAWNHVYDVVNMAGNIIAEENNVEFKDAFKTNNKFTFDRWNLKHNDSILPSVMCDSELYEYDKTLCEIRFIRGRETFKSQDGSVMALDFHKQWHTFDFTGPSYPLDAMASFYAARVGSPDVVGGYGIDNILSKQLKINKVEIDAGGRIGAELHIWMQLYNRKHYMTYMNGDVLYMLFLEEKNTDLSIQIPTLLSSSLYNNFTASSGYLYEDFYFYYKKNGKITGDHIYTRLTKKQEDENNELLNKEFIEAKDIKIHGENYISKLDRKGWTITINLWRNAGGGFKLFKDVNIPNTIGVSTVDTDLIGAYPSATNALDASKETTVREVIDVEGLEPEEFKQALMGNIVGEPGAMQVYCTINNGVTFLELDEFLDTGKIHDYTEQKIIDI